MLLLLLYQWSSDTAAIGKAFQSIFLFSFDLHAGRSGLYFALAFNGVLHTMCGSMNQLGDGRETRLLMIFWGQSCPDIGMCLAYALRFYNF